MAVKAHQFVGVDGEGMGRRPHVYTYLAAVCETGRFTRSIEHPTTAQALKFLLDIPKKFTVVGFAFQYDLTKILADLPDELLYQLMRPETREYWSYRSMRRAHRPVVWRGFTLDFQAGRFSVKKGSRTTVVWDVFKFFATKFTSALEAWNIQTDLEHMKRMKDTRHSFETADPEEIQAYCREECKCLAQLAQSLYQAHVAAGLRLKGFYGAGSTGAAMLEVLDVLDQRDDGPDAMRESLARGFFGGRFENSITGVITKPVWSYDISSAYPYQCTRLPCLRCGRWKYTRSETTALRSRAALIHTIVDIDERYPWGPFPFRTSKGEICYPHACETHVWRDEYVAGKKLCGDGVTFVGAWYLSGQCKCGRPHPFEGIAHYYRERVRIGKEGKGLAIKLGVNSCYGKLAQSIGTPKYQSWVWAGMITSGTRGMLLDAIRACKDPASMLMVATDGIYCLERLELPKPWDTGTYDLAKPLGGWEEKGYPGGIVAARPGVYFPRNPTDDQLNELRARGIGKGVMAKYWGAVTDALLERRDGVDFPSVQRFVGVVSGVYQTPRGEYLRSDDYGEWVERPIKLSFGARPKRDDGPWKGKYRVLLTRSFAGEESAPYDPALESPEARDAELMTRELLEQPDGDFSYA